MSTLILVFHPHLKDGSRVNARLLAELTAQGEDDIIVRDEYAEYPNFSVNADTEHELLEAADRVILQFPFYWYLAASEPVVTTSLSSLPLSAWPPP